MKRVKKPVFFIVTLFILALAYTSFFGLKIGDETLIKGANDIRWGIDIRGGVEVTFNPAEGVTATTDELEAAKSIIELRMVSTNITDYEIYTDTANNSIIVRFPWKSGETEFNPEEAIEELAATAKLTFRKGAEYTYTSTDSNGDPVYTVPKGETEDVVYLDGSHVSKAYPATQQDPITNELTYVVALEFNSEGAQLFEDATSENVGELISIWMDDVQISAATVNEAISGGSATISGNYDAESATALADKIQGGALPFELETSNPKIINPTLGETSLEAMLLAGVIAFALIAVFMTFMFKLPGFIAVITLIGQLGITFAALSGYFSNMPSFTMTLPGIAGIILSIGIGVDANIITASRIKEELHSGKTLDGAIQKGCQSSFSAILDGNVTIIIVAIMLIGVFGPGNILSILFGESTTGAIYSFGHTLLVGVISNFIMAVFASRLMIKSISGIKAFRKKSLYGGTQPKKKFNVDFYNNRKKFFAISAVILVIGLVSNVVLGAKLDIQFAGGAVIVYSVDGDIEEDKVADIVLDATGRESEVISSTLMATNENQVTVSFAGNEALSLDEQKAIETALTENYADRTFTLAESNSVEASTGARFFQKALICLAITVGLLLAYIAIRFKRIGGSSAGLTAILALVHDVLIIYFVFIIFGMGINEIFIAVILTILGYSLNDTIVIYDRIRENKQLMGENASAVDVMNVSLNQTLARSIMTSITTFIALLVIFIVSTIFGITTVSSFALPMMVGVLCGCYSSLFIAAPVYTMWKIKKSK